ncbi:MAG: hypothetical protein RI519_00410 [Balneolaceae bacterium]|nr:hypothetical protein [Balneolaceae bacterium]
MNILSNQLIDLQKQEKPSGGYEWWYFDAISSCKTWSVVLIFYEGNPFSPHYHGALQNPRSEDVPGPLPQEYPAVTLSLYKKGQPIYYSFQELEPQACTIDTSMQTHQVHLTFGPHTLLLVRDRKEYRVEIQLDDKLPNGDSLQGHLRYSSALKEPVRSHIGSSQDSLGAHSWILCMESAQVHAELQLGGSKAINLSFEGQGYHDHNVGMEPMHKSFSDWHWGRAHFEDGSFLLYYVMSQLEGAITGGAWISNALEGSVQFTQDVLITPFLNRSFFGLKNLKSLHITAENESILEVQRQTLSDNGPFYQRFHTKVTWGGDSAIGIGEYIVPSRIVHKSTWPLIRLRLRKAGHPPSWVQKSRFFYDLTWRSTFW